MHPTIDTTDTLGAAIAKRFAPEAQDEDPDGGYDFASSEEAQPTAREQQFHLLPLGRLGRRERRQMGIHVSGQLLRRLFLAVPVKAG